MKKQLNLGYGVQVTGVSEGRMADSGIRKGFIILKANGKQLKTVQDLEEVMKAASQSPDQVLFDWYNAKSAGVNNITYRINSNDYMYSLVYDFGFEVKRYV